MPLEFTALGYGASGQPTRRRAELFADWIEAECYSNDEPIFKAEFIDRIEGSKIVSDSDDSWALIDDGFTLCKLRRRYLKTAYPFNIAGDVIECDASADNGYIFCLLASLPEQFQFLRKSYPSNYRDIFEEIVTVALANMMPGWHVHHTGWSKIAEGGKGAVLHQVASWTGASVLDQGVFPNANDAQVDVAAVRHFADARGGVPVLLGQCATGVTDWKSKAIRPNIDRWTKGVRFPSQPTRLLAVPFALDDDSFREAWYESSGIILDRNRICGHLVPMSSALKASLDAWTEAARKLLPEAA